MATAKVKAKSKPKVKVGDGPRLRSRAKFNTHANRFFGLVEKASGKKLSDKCVEWALKRYSHFVWKNQPRFAGGFLKGTDQCCTDVGNAVKPIAGSQINLVDFKSACIKKEKGVSKYASAVGGICS